MKEVYEALSGLEGGEKLVELVKASVKELGEAQKENRSLKAEQEQYKDIDLATLKTMSEFVESSGGVEALQSALAKSEGYDTNEEKLKQKQAEFDAFRQKHEQEAEAFTAKLAESNLRAEVLPQFVDAFEGSNVLLDRAVSNGFVGKNESGLYFKNGDDVTPFSAGGFDKLKEHPDFSFALKKPSGGGEGAGSGAGDTSGNNKKTLAERFEQSFQA